MAVVVSRSHDDCVLHGRSLAKLKVRAEAKLRAARNSCKGSEPNRVRSMMRQICCVRLSICLSIVKLCFDPSMLILQLCVAGNLNHA